MCQYDDKYKGTLLDLFSGIITCCVRKPSFNYFANTRAVELSDELVHYYLHSRDYFSLFVSSVRITSET
jgi:hypothetical protein